MEDVFSSTSFGFWRIHSICTDINLLVGGWHLFQGGFATNHEIFTFFSLRVWTFNFESKCVSGVICSYIFCYKRPPSMFYMFWPDEDLDNEWPDHFVVSYDKELEKIPFVYLIVFTCLVIESDQSSSQQTQYLHNHWCINT